MRKNLLKIIHEIHVNQKVIKVSKPIGKITNFKTIDARATDLDEVIYIFDALLDEGDLAIADIFFGKKNKYDINNVRPLVRQMLKDISKFSDNVGVDNDFESAFGMTNIKGNKRVKTEILYLLNAISTKEGSDLTSYYVENYPKK